MAGSPELHKGLNQRQLSMIAIGGVIGAGLFVGSSNVFLDAGPGAFITYGITGVLIILIMRMLGEMATANPSTGSFADYARKAMGGWAGFSVAWLYWYFWVIVVGFEAVAGGEILRHWFPDVPLWVFSLILMALMTATNLFSVASFGEFEFWFAGIKVATIIVFLALGALFVIGLWPGAHLDFSNLTSHGGFFPNGVGAIFSGVVVVVFSMVGAEIATIAAAESPDPAKAIGKATNSVITRIAIFYVGSALLLALIVPWDENRPGFSPFVAAMERMNIPFAADIMNLVVLTAVLSCLNSGLYTASRMLFVLAARREAPVGLIRVSKGGVPRRAILVSSVIGFLCVIAAAISPDTVFSFLLNSSGAIILFVYLLIGISQIVLRRRTDPSKFKIKMWGFPFLSILATVGIFAVLVQMAFNPDTLVQLLLSLGSWAIVIIAFFVTKARGGSVDPEALQPEVNEKASRVLVMANETVAADELIEELRRIDRAGKAEYYICVPANPVDTGQAEKKGAVYIWEATVEAAQARLDTMMGTLRAENLHVEGALGDYRPLRALAEAVESFHPDQLVISTKPETESDWLRYDVVQRARSTYDIPLTHVIAGAPVAAG